MPRTAPTRRSQPVPPTRQGGRTVGVTTASPAASGGRVVIQRQGRPMTVLPTPEGDTLREAFAAIAVARGEVERTRDAFAAKLRAMRAAGYSVSACARHLGLSRQYLYEEYLGREAVQDAGR